MIIPEYLQEGDTIAIAAPARKISIDELEASITFLHKEGFQVYYDERLFAEQHQFAGADEVRAAYFQNLLDNPTIKAIWCARGGYGSVRIIDRLHFENFCRHPKWICGYSDITVFHSHLNRHFNIATLHTTMPVNIHAGNDELRSNRSFIAALKGQTLQYEVNPHPLNRPGLAEAPVVGGNLSMLYSLLGSPSDLNTDGRILLIEEVDEYLYHIDRMMTNLQRNGKLDKLAALLVGHFTDMHDNTIPYGQTATEIIAEHCRHYDYPLIFNFPCGHEADNVAVPLGTTMHIANQGPLIKIIC